MLFLKSIYTILYKLKNFFNSNAKYFNFNKKINNYNDMNRLRHGTSGVSK